MAVNYNNDGYDWVAFDAANTANATGITYTANGIEVSGSLTLDIADTVSVASSFDFSKETIVSVGDLMTITLTGASITAGTSNLGLSATADMTLVLLDDGTAQHIAVEATLANATLNLSLIHI